MPFFFAYSKRFYVNKKVDNRLITNFFLRGRDDYTNIHFVLVPLQIV